MGESKCSLGQTAVRRLSRHGVYFLSCAVVGRDHSHGCVKGLKPGTPVAGHVVYMGLDFSDTRWSLSVFYCNACGVIQVLPPPPPVPHAQPPQSSAPLTPASQRPPPRCLCAPAAPHPAPAAAAQPAGRPILQTPVAHAHHIHRPTAPAQNAVVCGWRRSAPAGARWLRRPSSRCGGCCRVHAPPRRPVRGSRWARAGARPGL